MSNRVALERENMRLRIELERLRSQLEHEKSVAAGWLREVELMHTSAHMRAVEEKVAADEAKAKRKPKAKRRRKAVKSK